MKILVVDDSKVMRSIVLRTLRQAGFGGHTIEEAGDGRAALQLINNSPPDLVLTDWNMPEMSGLNLLQKVRAQGNKVPFVFVTSEATEDQHALAAQEGASAVITKPFNMDSFQKHLSGLIG